MLHYKWLGAAASDAHRYHSYLTHRSASTIMIHLPDSTTTDTKRAQNVCHACMLRKKACDKTLPACGFCVSRQLLCRYDISAPMSKDRRAYNPGRHFVRLRSTSPPLVSPRMKVMKLGELPSPERQRHDAASIQQSSLYVLPTQPVEESLHHLAQHFAELSKITYDNIIDRYFRAFHFQDSHQWIPVVSSPDSLRQEASRYREEGRLPPVDFTALLLAMLLTVLPTLGPSSRPPRASRELLYTATKSAFAQAQASICTSLRLVQAALLIALREYTSIRPEAAYISMMTCVGMSRVLRIGIPSLRNTSDVRKPTESQLEETERENLALAIVMLERYE